MHRQNISTFYIKNKNVIFLRFCRSEKFQVSLNIYQELFLLVSLLLLHSDMPFIHLAKYHQLYSLCEKKVNIQVLNHCSVYGSLKIGIYYQEYVGICRNRFHTNRVVRDSL